MIDIGKMGVVYNAVAKDGTKAKFRVIHFDHIRELLSINKMTHTLGDADFLEQIFITYDNALPLMQGCVKCAGDITWFARPAKECGISEAIVQAIAEGNRIIVLEYMDSGFNLGYNGTLDL